MKNEGKIYRNKEKDVIVEIQGKPNLKDLPGVTCLDSHKPVAEKTYQKIFKKKQIYLPKEYDLAITTYLSGTDVIIIGMNGYSSLTPQQCQEWGVKVGAYEAACSALLNTTISYLQNEFPGIDVRVVHGASNLGVDQAIINTANLMNRPQLGFSCPKFMFYVNDDDVPVYVASTQDEYSRAFAKSLDILIAANGRIQSFEHDIDAAFKFRKHVIPVNVLKSISTTGGPPAFKEEGHIEDAVAAMELLVHMVSMQLGGERRDPWENLLEHIHKTIGSIARQVLSPRRAFGNS